MSVRKGGGSRGGHCQLRGGGSRGGGGGVPRTQLSRGAAPRRVRGPHGREARGYFKQVIFLNGKCKVLHHLGEPTFVDKKLQEVSP